MNPFNLIKLNEKKTVKNSLKQEFDIPTNLEELNKWTIPKIEPKVIYQLGTFEKLGLKQVVKTTEESISLNNEEMVLKLLSENDILSYITTHKFIHIGLVQIAFKPLTLTGLPESFIAALRDARNLDWKQSLMGIIQSSLAHGPVYFDVYPNLQLSLTDENILDSLTLNVKTNGYNYLPGSELICICYRIYFKPLHTLNPNCKRVNKNINETILIETNFGKSKITTRKPIKWEEIQFPETWKIEKAIPIQSQITSNITDIFQNEEGDVEIKLENSTKLLRSNSMLRSNSQRSSYYSNRSYISPINYLVENPGNNSRASTSKIDETRTEGLVINQHGIVYEREAEIMPTASEMEFNI